MTLLKYLLWLDKNINNFCVKGLRQYYVWIFLCTEVQNVRNENLRDGIINLDTVCFYQVSARTKTKKTIQRSCRPDNTQHCLSLIVNLSVFSTFLLLPPLSERFTIQLFLHRSELFPLHFIFLIWASLVIKNTLNASMFWYPVFYWIFTVSVYVLFRKSFQQ